MSWPKGTACKESRSLALHRRTDKEAGSRSSTVLQVLIMLLVLRGITCPMIVIPLSVMECQSCYRRSDLPGCGQSLGSGEGVVTPDPDTAICCACQQQAIEYLVDLPDS